VGFQHGAQFLLLFQGVHALRCDNAVEHRPAGHAGEAREVIEAGVCQQPAGLSGKLEESHHHPFRLLAVHPQPDGIADGNPGQAFVKHLVENNGVLVAGQNPSPGSEDGFNQGAVGGNCLQDDCLPHRSIRLHQFGAGACPALHRDHPRHLLEDGGHFPDGMGFRKRQVDISNEILAQPVHVMVNGGAHIEHPDENCPAQDECDQRKHQAQPPPEGVAQGDEHGAGKPADFRQPAVHHAGSVCIAGTRPAERLLDGNARPLQNGQGTGNLRDDQGNQRLQEDAARHRLHRRQVEINPGREESQQGICRPVRECQCKPQRRQAVHQDQHHVDAADLEAAGADGFHHAHLLDLLVEQGGERIGDDEGTQENHQEPQHHQQPQHRLEVGVVGVGGAGHCRPADGDQAVALKFIHQRARHGLDVFQVCIAAADGGVELVEQFRLFQPGKGFECDVPLR